MKLPSRLLLMAAAAALAASCAEPPPPPAPLPPVYVPAAAPAPPPVALSRPVLESASTYRSYMRQASSISPAFLDGQSVEQSLLTGAAYEQRQLLRGAIAYGALVALQSPQFVAGVRTYAVNPNGRRALAQRLMSDPNYAAALPSAASAAGMVVAALTADAAALRRAGELVKQAAYDVQRQNWSKAEVIGRDERLATTKSLSTQQVLASPDDVQILASTVNGSNASALGLIGGDALTPPFAPAVSRALAVAALAALGEAGEINDAYVQPLLDDSSGAFCLNMGKLNLYQCLSVAKPYYEDVFCLGQHILLDTAQCISKAAGIREPIAEVVTPSATAQAYRPVAAPVSRPAARPAVRRTPAKPAAKR